MRLLEDKEWGKWSNVEIGKRCNVSDMTVKRIRDESSLQQSGSEPRTYTTKHGTQATMHTANIGKAPRAVVDESPEEEDEPEEQEVLPEVNRTIEMAIGYMNILFEDYPNLVDKHFICNSVLKFLKQKSIEFNTES
jgi:hypothetical protein